jgi:hypothetical protein
VTAAAAVATTITVAAAVTSLQISRSWVVQARQLVVVVMVVVVRGRRRQGATKQDGSPRSTHQRTKQMIPVAPTVDPQVLVQPQVLFFRSAHGLEVGNWPPTPEFNLCR